ncbi:MAG: hypothetical protein M3178_11565 [Pseudomonadota bacterium]|nr:hypothetical protein [Pseudomonadota bacterium]
MEREDFGTATRKPGRQAMRKLFSKTDGRTAGGAHRPLPGTVFKRLGRIRVAPFFRADLGIYIGMVVDRGGDLTTVGMRISSEGR